MDMQVQDGSNDRKYFLMIPYCVLDMGDAVEQALYLQMKRRAGESSDGECFTSHRTLMKKIGVGKYAFMRALNNLIKWKLIYLRGKRLVDTQGGMQMVNVYGIADIWKENIYRCQGASKTDPLPLWECETDSVKVRLNQPKVVRSSPSKKIYKKIYIKEENNNVKEKKRQIAQMLKNIKR